MKPVDERTIRVLEYEKIIEMLAKHTVSPLGRAKALSLRPSNDKEFVRKCLEETTEAASFIASEGHAYIDFFPDIRAALKRAKIGSKLSIKEILEVGTVLRTAHNIKRNALEVVTKREMTHLAQLIDGLTPSYQLMKRIFDCIESEERLSDNASSELASIRRNIQKANEKVRERLNSIISSPQFQKYLQDPIITIRNDRYVVPVKQEYRGNVPGLIHDQSSSGATLFIEPISVVEANNELREWIIKEEKEVERILYLLSAAISEASEDIEKDLDILVELDFIFAKGKFSLSLKGVCPRLVDDYGFHIKNGRHPLIKEEEVVPINIWLGKDFSTLVITGPNTGGKTVTLKTVGLFALMTQAGLHLPADEGTEMGVFSNVFADIGDEQSIEQSLSTFSSHMTNIVKIIDQVDYSSLVLFDELGAGTDPTEGAALAMSILKYLHERNVPTLATTHYSELKVFALTHEGIENAAMEFDVETLQPTYRLMIGIPGKSNAFEISRRLGLKAELIDSAREMLSQEDIRFEDLLKNMEYNRLAAQRDREEARKIKEHYEKLKIDIEKKLKKLEEDREKVLQKARDEARKLIREAKEEANAIIKELQQLKKETEEKEFNKAIEEARSKLRNEIEKIGESLSLSKKSDNGMVKAPKNLMLGETVYVANLEQFGQVLALPDQNNEVLVQVGIMKVNVHLSNLRKVSGTSSNQQQASSKKLSLRNKSVSPELDLRGANVEEAVLQIDRYLDDAFLSGLNEVTLIHGKGTGALRSGIHQHLKNHPHVASFRLGKYGEGESGVTIVELK